MRRPGADEGRRWLRQAQRDLEWAEHLVAEGGLHLACFLAQQVAEKALKAYLYAQGAEVVLGHSVRELCERAAAQDDDYAPVCDSWGTLDSYYVTARYPNGLPGGIPADAFSADTAASAVGLAREAVELTAGKLA